MKLTNLSIIILAGNEEKMIVDCLKSCSFSQEIILVAANSTDNTINLAKQTIPSIKIVKTNDGYNRNFSKWRNLGLKNSTKDWVLYIDSDERVGKALQEEISKIVSGKSLYSHYALPRANFYLGKRVKHGGSYPDYAIRLFQKKYLHGYQGILHEQPIVDGQISYLKSDLSHFTHRDLSSMLQKTLVWTDMEAKALFENNHPPVVWWRIIRMMLTKIWERLIIEYMWRDGTVGWISVIFETFDTFLIYARLWEIQQKAKK